MPRMSTILFWFGTSSIHFNHGPSRSLWFCIHWGRERSDCSINDEIGNHTANPLKLWALLRRIRVGNSSIQVIRTSILVLDSRRQVGKASEMHIGRLPLCKVKQDSIIWLLQVYHQTSRSSGHVEIEQVVVRTWAMSLANSHWVNLALWSSRRQSSNEHGKFISIPMEEGFVSPTLQRVWEAFLETQVDSDAESLTTCGQKVTPAPKGFITKLS